MILLHLSRTALDLPTAALCLAIAVAFCVLHAVSGAKRAAWIDLPAYVRRPMILTAIGFVARSADLVRLGGPEADPAAAGHIDVPGFALCLLLAITLSAWSIFVVRRGAVLVALARRSWWIAGKPLVGVPAERRRRDRAG